MAPALETSRCGKDLNINLTSSVKDLMSWSEKVAKEEEAMKVLVHS